jgi:hypothetical protein
MNEEFSPNLAQLLAIWRDFKQDKDYEKNSDGTITRFSAQKMIHRIETYESEPQKIQVIVDNYMNQQIAKRMENEIKRNIVTSDYALRSKHNFGNRPKTIIHICNNCLKKLGSDYETSINGIGFGRHKVFIPYMFLEYSHEVSPLKDGTSQIAISVKWVVK